MERQERQVLWPSNLLLHRHVLQLGHCFYSAESGGHRRPVHRAPRQAGVREDHRQHRQVALQWSIVHLTLVGMMEERLPKDPQASGATSRTALALAAMHRRCRTEGV